MKLWEVMKALDENPKKVFRSKVTNSRLMFKNGELVWENQFMKIEKFTIYDKRTFVEFDSLIDNTGDIWEEVKQPVTWQEAIEAWVSGKTIKCTIQGSDYVFDGHKPKLRGQIDTIDRSQLRDGTWYIED